jgi:hypothetical protein
MAQMPDFYQKITEMQGTLEDLARKIPGFQGYFEKEDRRAADRLLRDHLVRVYEEQLNEFTRLQQRLVSSGGLRFMERVQGIDTQLRTFIDRIKTASQGYSGVFDAVKVDAESLKRVYAFDNALLIYQDQLATGLKQLEEAIGGEVEGVLSQLEEVAHEANNTFKRREEALQGLQILMLRLSSVQQSIVQQGEVRAWQESSISSNIRM